MSTTLSREHASFLTADRDWWRQATVYQIYPRSFADSNADGIGDLVGITSKIDYLSQLGIDAVWLSPFYPSALADGGYDVDNYREIDPRIGTLDQFDAMVSALHGAGIKVIVDIVPNHSSNLHEWFQEALAAPKGSPERNRYIFRDGLGENGELPPSDWDSIFGGSAWEPVGDGQWYLHLFATEQPDFNWDNAEVREDFLKTLRFWSDRGVDGFRVDVAHGLAKRLPEQLPNLQEIASAQEAGEPHPFWDRDEVHEIYLEWRKVFNEYNPPRIAVAEAWVGPERLAAYASKDGLGQAFNFDLLEAPFDASRFKEIVDAGLEKARQLDSSSTWVFSNHDVVRHATRYGLSTPSDAEEDITPRDIGLRWLLAEGPESELDRETGIRRARAATLFKLGLPGSAYIYQGEELGLHEVADLDAEQRQDPTFFRSGGAEVGRDGCRVPLPWTREGSSFGFGDGGAHLEQPEWFAEHSVEAEDANPDSTLNLYRAALELRRTLQTDEELEWIKTGRDDVLHYRRPGEWEIIMNFGTEPAPLPQGRVVLASGAIGSDLPGETTVWFAP